MAARQPNGRVRPVHKAQPDGGYSPTLVKRMADLAARKLSDAFFGTALGIAFLNGRITKEQAAAGRRWAQARSDWLRAIDASRLDLQLMTMGEPRRRLDPDEDSYEGQCMTDRDIAACRRYHRLESVLMGCGEAVLKNARALSEAPALLSLSFEEMAAATVGLEALRRHLQGDV